MPATYQKCFALLTATPHHADHAAIKPQAGRHMRWCHGFTRQVASILCNTPELPTQSENPNQDESLTASATRLMSPFQRVVASSRNYKALRLDTLSCPRPEPQIIRDARFSSVGAGALLVRRGRRVAH